MALNCLILLIQFNHCMALVANIISIAMPRRKINKALTNKTKLCAGRARLFSILFNLFRLVCCVIVVANECYANRTNETKALMFNIIVMINES